MNMLSRPTTLGSVGWTPGPNNLVLQNPIYEADRTAGWRRVDLGASAWTVRMWRLSGADRNAQHRFTVQSAAVGRQRAGTGTRVPMPVGNIPGWRQVSPMTSTEAKSIAPSGMSTRAGRVEIQLDGSTQTMSPFRRDARDQRLPRPTQQRAMGNGGGRAVVDLFKPTANTSFDSASIEVLA